MDNFEPHVIDRPPMSLEQFKLQELRSFGKVFASCVLASLIFAGIVAPWNNAWAHAPFVVLFVAGAWLLLGKRTPKRRAGE